MTYSKLKKKDQTIAVTMLVTVKKNQGKLSYHIKSGNSKIKFDTKKNKLTLPRGLKKGTYPIAVTVTAAGKGVYKKGSKTVTVNVKVK